MDAADGALDGTRPGGAGAAPGRDGRAAGVSTTRLHRVETGATRSGRVAEAYERVLGMPDGSLRAPVDVACRTFTYALSDRDPGQPVTSTRDMSELTEVLQGAVVTSGQWLRWARALVQPGAIGLPEEELRAGLTEAVLCAAGPTGHPCLRALAADPALSERARGAAAWWLRAGSRIVV